MLDGVRLAVICNNANEMIQGNFYQMLKDAACQLTLVHPYMPWSNAAERKIKELKKVVHCKLS